MSLRKHLEHFAQNTSMHGFGRVILTKRPEKRAAWVIVFLSAWALFAYQLTDVLTKYFEYSKKTTTEFVSGGAPFPSITLCNMQSFDFYAVHKFINAPKAKKQKSDLKYSLLDFPEVNTSFLYNYEIIREVVNRYWHRKETPRSEFDDVVAMHTRSIFVANLPDDVANEIGTKRQEFIVKCTYGDSSCEFTEMPHPYYLKCFTFEPPHIKNTRFENLQSLSEGIANGFSVTVFTGIKSSDISESEARIGIVYQRNSHLAGSSGIRVVVHPPGTEPFPLTEGYDVPPGYQVSMGIVPERRKRLGKPYGQCAEKNIYKKNYLDELHGLETDQNEPYRKISCERMCMQEHVIHECNCVDDELPNTGNIEHDAENDCRLFDKQDTRSSDFHYKKVHTCRNIPGLKECALNAKCNASMVGDTLRNIRCANNITKRLMTNLESLSKCNCYAPCDEFRYQVSYSLSKWPSSGYEGGAVYNEIFQLEKFTARFRGGKREMYEKYVNMSGAQPLDDFAKINVYITDSSVLQISEKPATTITQLISEIGGQLGIWIGVSVITISEVLETILKISAAGIRRLCSKIISI